MAKPRRVPRYVQRELEECRKEPVFPRRILADISKHAPHNSYCGGPLYYEDVEFTCRDCGRQAVWTAEQQQWWFEVAQGSIYARAIRCEDCRRRLRDAHAGTPRRSHQNRRDEASDPPVRF